MHDKVIVIAHHGVGVNAVGKDATQFKKSAFNTGPAVLKTSSRIGVEATQPRSAHTAVDTMESSGLGWIDELAAGLGHRRSLCQRALRENQIGRSFGSDLSDALNPKAKPTTRRVS